MGGVGDSGFLEAVIQAFSFRDLESFAETLVIRAKAQETADQGFVGAVAFACSCEGAMELEEALLWGAAYQAAGEESETAGSGSVRRGGAHHHRAYDV
jgi:hypothetical protein